jgi:HSP20 family molecular chaperone IbpA
VNRTVSFTLAIEVDIANIQASYDYGILSVVLPKAEYVRPKSIKVNVSK